MTRRFLKELNVPTPLHSTVSFDGVLNGHLYSSFWIVLRTVSLPYNLVFVPPPAKYSMFASSAESRRANRFVLLAEVPV